MSSMVLFFVTGLKYKNQVTEFFKMKQFSATIVFQTFSQRQGHQEKMVEDTLQNKRCCTQCFSVPRRTCSQLLNYIDFSSKFYLWKWSDETLENLLIVLEKLLEIECETFDGLLLCWVETEYNSAALWLTYTMILTETRVANTVFRVIVVQSIQDFSFTKRV